MSGKKSGKKHDWNNYNNYIIVHERVLRDYAGHFINNPVYDLEQVTSQMLDMRVTILLHHKHLKIEIEKTVEIQELGRLKVARTYAYSYNVSDSIGNFFRYYSPHPSHRAYHHKHVYDEITRDEKHSSPFVVGEDDYPHVNEVIDEALRL